jgi:CheY-like chemotaxis protein
VRLVQEDMAELTGLPMATYRRVERGELTNPPIRYLVNCWHVLRTRQPDLALADLLEPDWMGWTVFSRTAQSPPSAVRLAAEL